MENLKLITPYIRKSVFALILGFIALIICDFTQMMIPKLVGSVIDRLSDESLGMNFIYPILAIIAVAVIVGVMRYAWRHLIYGFSRILEKNLRQRLYSRYVELSVAWHNENSTGNLMALATNDIESIRLAIGFGLVSLVDSIVLGSAAVVFMLSINPKLCLFAFLPLPFITITTGFFGRRIYKRVLETQNIFGSLTEVIREHISGFKVIRAMALEELAKSEVERESIGYMKKNILVSVLMGLFFPLLSLLTNLALALTLFFGGNYVIRGTISPGDFVAFLTYLALLAYPFMALGYTIGLLQQGLASLSRIGNVLNLSPSTVHPVLEGKEIRKEDFEISENKIWEFSTLKKEEILSSFEEKKELLESELKREEIEDKDIQVLIQRELDGELKKELKEEKKFEKELKKKAILEKKLKKTEKKKMDLKENSKNESKLKENVIPSNKLISTGKPLLRIEKLSPDIITSIEFKDIDFSYQGRLEKALDNLSCDLLPYGITALTGPTGSGKSTLAALLPALYEPDNGLILINGKASTEYSLTTLRKLFTYIPQEGHIFTGTIFENIAFGKPEASKDEVLKIAELAAIPIEESVFPEGLETRVGEKGITLSGGQKQRLALARAILMDPPYLILDDTLSAVDASVEEKILNTLLATRVNKGTLIISHRVTSLKRAEYFLVLEKGILTGKGTFEEVLTQSPYFKRIVDLANLGFDNLGLVPEAKKQHGQISKIAGNPPERAKGLLGEKIEYE